MTLGNGLAAVTSVVKILSANGATMEYPGYVWLPIGNTCTWLAAGLHDWDQANVCGPDGDYLSNEELTGPRDTAAQVAASLLAARDRRLNA